MISTLFYWKGNTGQFFTWFQAHSVPQNDFNNDIVSPLMKEILPFNRVLLGGRGKHHKSDATDGKLGKGLFKLRVTSHLSLHILVGFPPGHSSHFSSYICFASSRYYFSIKHSISLLPDTPTKGQSLTWTMEDISRHTITPLWLLLT